MVRVLAPSVMVLICVDGKAETERSFGDSADSSSISLRSLNARRAIATAGRHLVRARARARARKKLDGVRTTERRWPLGRFMKGLR